MKETLKVALVGFVIAGCSTMGRGPTQEVGLQGKIELLAQELAADVRVRRKLTVAVTDLTDIWGRKSKLGSYVADKLAGSLRNTGRFYIVERRLLDKLWEEQRLGLIGVLDPSSAPDVGKLFGADAILVGTVTDLGTSVDVNVRLIDAERGTVLAAADVQLRKDMKLRRLLPYAENLRLSMSIVAERVVDGRIEEVIVEDGGTLRSGDTFKVLFRTNEDGYAYVFIYDSQGRIEKLFPNPRTGTDNRILGGRTYTVPPGDLWFELDEHTGMETIYVIASYKPVEEVERLLSSIAGGFEREVRNMAGWRGQVHIFSERGVELGKERKIYIPVTTRGIRVVGKEQATYCLSDGRAVHGELEVLEGGDIVVRAISFYHR